MFDEFSSIEITLHMSRSIMMRSILVILIFSPLIFTENSTISYTDVLNEHCSPPFHFYKSWCYYLVPQLSLDWISANRYCRSIDSQTFLLFINDSDEMIDPLRDILIVRENFPSNETLWTNTSWGDQRRTILTRQSKRSCRKLQLKSRTKTGQIDSFRMPFGNCREKHRVLCRKELPSNIFCPRPWAFAYGICYYLDEQVRFISSEEEERNQLQCQAWQGELFFSSKAERSILPSFLFYSLHALHTSEILHENFGGISYEFSNLIDQTCSIVSGDAFLSATIKSLRKTNETQSCSTFRSHTFCRQRFESTCSPPWFADDGFCLYFSPNRTFDRAAAAAECYQQGGSLLYISNEEELFRLTKNLPVFSRFFPSLSLSGVWLAVSRRAPYAQTPAEFEWLWDYSVRSNLDFQWETIEWKRFFQWRLSPDLVSAGECAALILDRQIREPIERTSCDYPRTVICRKPFENHQHVRSFHHKDRYKKMTRQQNFNEISKKILRENSSVLSIQRTIFEPLNSSFYRWIVYLNGSTMTKRNGIFVCQSKEILHEEILPSNSLVKIDVMIKTGRTEFEIIFDYLRSNECFRNRSNESCLFVTCQSNDRWASLLPEIVSRWNSSRSSSMINERCAKRPNLSTSDRILCTILLEQFRLIDERNFSNSTTKTNRCEDFNGQCVIASHSFLFVDPFLNCSNGFSCVFQGERCHSNGFCLDRIRFPCPSASILSNVSCSNSHYDCCLSSSSTLKTSSIIISTTTKSSTWDIFLPLFYFSFNSISKWDRLFFDRWMKTDVDLSEDFINDEFVFSCQGIFLDSTLLLTHQSCRPISSILSDDKRSILFSLVKKSHFDPNDVDQYDRIALQLDSFQIYSPFQLIRLANRPDFLFNKTFKRLNQNPLINEQSSTLHCVLVQNENLLRSIRILNDFQRQIFFEDTNGVFLLENNDDETDEMTWPFAPIICVVPEENFQWIIIGISGQQLNHRCIVDQQKKFCQMTPIVGSTSIWN